MDVHQGSSAIHPETDFAFTVVTSFKEPLTRQIVETVKIQRALDHGTFESLMGNIAINSLNRRSEHFAPQERKRNLNQ